MPGTNLRLVFKGVSDRKITFNYPDANSSASDVQVKTLMQLIIANNDVFAEPPMTMESAAFVTTMTTPVNLN